MRHWTQRALRGHRMQRSICITRHPLADTNGEGATFERAPQLGFALRYKTDIWTLRISQQGYVMSSSQLRQRFEITIQSQGRMLKHVCAAPEEAEAVDRIMRSYKQRSPVLVNVKRLGVLPAKLRR